MAKTLAFGHQATYSGISLVGNSSHTAGQLLEVDEPVANSSTVEIAFALDYTKLEALFLVSDRAVTVEFVNNSEEVDHTVTLVANSPYIWKDDGYYGNPLSASIIHLSVANASGAQANVKAVALIDPT